jgi:calcineurin-like phosphoesterase family protein
MRKFITSDLHFGHANIMNFCPVTRSRFKDVVDMREKMIADWNREVAQEDETFILGDFAFLPAKDAVDILRRLNGSKILIEGNHDRKLLNDPAFRREFKEVHQYLRYNHDGQLVIMLHYPIYEWDQMHRGAVHFYGHVHGKITGLEKYRARDVAFDATGRVVSDFDMMIADALKGEIRAHH